jgi:zinc transport system ATP-binding protein
MSLLKCERVNFCYEGRPAVTRISFEVKTGDYLAVVGENGAGKSTLMKGLICLKKPSKGKVEFGEGLRTSEIGYLPQQTQVQKDFPASVSEVVLSGCLNSLGRRAFFTKEQKNTAREKMEMLGISPLKDRCYRDLSGGQQQRVLLARALCAAKKILFLDEPVTGLDPLVSESMYQIIRKLREEQKMTIVMVSHDVEGAVREASHILHIAGRQKFFGTADAYRASPIGKAFLKGGIE